MTKMDSAASRWATGVIAFTALIWSGFAVWLGVWPDSLMEGFGIQKGTAAMRTEIRAFYGGVEVGIAVAMVVLWFRRELGAALLIGGLPLLFAAAGRGAGMWIDGFSGMHALLATAELTGAAVCLHARSRLHRIGA